MCCCLVDISWIFPYGYDEKGRQNRRIEAATATYTLNETNKVLSVELSDARYYLRTSEAVEDEGMDTQAMSTWEIFTWGSASQELDMSRLMNAELKPDLSEMTWSQLRDELAQARTGEIAAGPIVFHLHRQVAGAFACVCFALVGIPLGKRVWVLPWRCWWRCCTMVFRSSRSRLRASRALTCTCLSGCPILCSSDLAVGCFDVQTGVVWLRYGVS